MTGSKTTNTQSCQFLLASPVFHDPIINEMKRTYITVEDSLEFFHILVLLRVHVLIREAYKKIVNVEPRVLLIFKAYFISL